MENVKCKIIARHDELILEGIDYHLTGLEAIVTKELAGGYYNILVKNLRINTYLTNDIEFSIPMKYVLIYPQETDDIKIYVDLDNVLADYAKAHANALEKNPKIQYPQSQYGFFADLDVIPNKFNYLAKFFNLKILSSPSARNPMCYTEKRIWVEKNISYEAAMNMILAPDKSEIGTERDYLIDDMAVHERSRQQDFRGTLIHYGSEEFPDWQAVSQYFVEKYNLKDGKG